MDVIVWIVLGLGAGVLANMAIPGRRGEPEPVLRPGGQRTGRAAASRLSPLPAGGDRIR
jgi:hypothetical protein